MHQSTALPDLRMLPTANLVPHEDCDPRRIERLSKRLLEEGILKNPPVVAPIPGGDKYVVLDGANRVMSFVQAGISHIVAQLVDYGDPGVILDTWYHVVAGMEIDAFEEALTQVCRMQLEPCSLIEARRALEVDAAAAYIVCESGVRKVLPSPACLSRDMQLLGGLVDAYKGKADIFRASNDVWELQKPYYPQITALVIFPRLHPADILAAAQNGYKIPSGITRHVIPARALNINVPIGILMTDWPLDRKADWLRDWLMGRMAANAIRYYAEATFSYNE